MFTYLSIYKIGGNTYNYPQKYDFQCGWCNNKYTDDDINLRLYRRI